MKYKKQLLLLITSFIALNLLGEVDLDDVQKELLETLPSDQRKNVLQKMEQADSLKNEIDTTFETGPTTLRRPEDIILNNF